MQPDIFPSLSGSKPVNSTMCTTLVMLPMFGDASDYREGLTNAIALTGVGASLGGLSRRRHCQTRDTQRGRITLQMSFRAGQMKLVLHPLLNKVTPGFRMTANVWGTLTRF